MRKNLFATLSLWILLLLTGCNKDMLYLKEHYDIRACQDELAVGRHMRIEKTIDKIYVNKKKRIMYLYSEGKVVDKVPVSLGQNPVGHKQQQGDLRTPEGKYYIRNKICSSKYFRSLAISYPNPADIERAKKRGVDPGGDIMIHAQPKWNADGRGDAYALTKNWTEGCIAVTNKVMQDIWYRVPIGVPVIIE